MYELKKSGKVFTSKFVWNVPSSYEKRIYRAAVSQRLRNAGLEYPSVQWLCHTKRSARKKIARKKIWLWWYCSEREVLLCPFETEPSLHTIGQQILHSFISSLTTP